MSTVLLTSNYRPEYRRAGILAWEAQAGTVMVFSYQPRHIAPDVSLCLNDNVRICMQCVDDPDKIYQVQWGTIIGLVYDKDRLYITLKFNSEEVNTLEELEDFTEPADARGYCVFDSTVESDKE